MREPYSPTVEKSSVNTLLGSQEQGALAASLYPPPIHPSTLGTSLHPQASTEQRQNERAGKQTGDLRENLPTSGIVWHDSHMRKFGSVLTRDGRRARIGEFCSVDIHFHSQENESNFSRKNSFDVCWYHDQCNFHERAAYLAVDPAFETTLSEEIWAALNVKVLRADDGRLRRVWSSAFARDLPAAGPQPQGTRQLVIERSARPSERAASGMFPQLPSQCSSSLPLKRQELQQHFRKWTDNYGHSITGRMWTLRNSAVQRRDSKARDDVHTSTRNRINRQCSIARVSNLNFLDANLILYRGDSCRGERWLVGRGGGSNLEAMDLSTAGAFTFLVGKLPTAKSVGMRLWAALNIELLRVDEGDRGEYGGAPEFQGRGNGRSPRKPAYQRQRRAPIPTSENPGVARPGIEPGSPWWEASRLTAAPIQR
ncbi:hypothetical protein PR048_005002 [Dryococelus australis]|uniref:Uncharacterized protein n=1 Tax=Dryococelus australis TaxID=614101 RepID=A0ABQ9I701_9NEOP|nr:hypothetical protein PR048_005002 [Dryococelus australis]